MVYRKILAIGSVLLVCGGLPAFAGGNQEERTRSFALEGVENLVLSFTAARVVRLRADAEGGALVVVERRSNKRVAWAKADSEGGTLNVTGTKRAWIPFTSHRYEADITLPASYRGSITVVNSSGTIVCEGDIAADGDVDLRVSSGHITIETLSAQNVTLEAASGTITAAALDGSRNEIQTASGTIAIGSLSGVSRLSAASGKITVDRILGKASITAHSGTVRAGVAELSGDLSFNLTSGNLYLDLPEESAFYLDADTAGGRVSVTGRNGAYDVRPASAILRPVGENPEYTIFVKLTSGNAEIARVLRPDASGETLTAERSPLLGKNIKQLLIGQWQGKDTLSIAEHTLQFGSEPQRYYIIFDSQYRANSVIHIEDTGSFDFTLSDDGRTLTLLNGDDAQTYQKVRQ